ncbi:MAG: hypothetical protein WC080_04690 [Patescibacteria group bacterium]
MSSELDEIIKRINLVLRSKKSEFFFLGKELEDSPTKRSIIHQLSDLGVLHIGLDEPFSWKDLDISKVDRSVSNRYSSLHESEKYNEAFREELEKQIDWKMTISIDEEKFRELLQSEKLRWDGDDLTFKDEKIKFTRNKRPYFLLKTLFSNPDKLWGYDEIAAEWSEEYSKNDWSKYYQAAYSANESIAKTTKIKDFLLITSKDVRINPLRLEK